MKKDGLLGLILASHAAMLAFLMLTQSPNIDEVAHVACGTVIWDYGVFEFYCVNPPLVRAIASLPAALAQKDASWIREPAVPELRPEFAYGSLFAES